MDQYWQIAGSAVAGSAFASMLARAFIAKSLEDLDTAVTKIADINTKLAEITVRLETLDRSHSLLHELDRKVIALETKVNASKRM